MKSLILVTIIISVEKVIAANMLGLDGPWGSVLIYLPEHSIQPICPLMITYVYQEGLKIIS